jgi:hypothetical protein
LFDLIPPGYNPPRGKVKSLDPLAAAVHGRVIILSHRRNVKHPLKAGLRDED